jgi:hypothetical protein
MKTGYAENPSFEVLELIQWTWFVIRFDGAVTKNVQRVGREIKQSPVLV